jgi:hypothetical protein
MLHVFEWRIGSDLKCGGADISHLRCKLLLEGCMTARQ